MLSHALVVKIIAKVDRAEEVATFLAGALPLAQSELFTPVWFALRANATTFYIVDAFGSAGDRQQHLDGSIAAALMAKASELLAEPPAIEPVDVLASKMQ
ncbi:MAG: antibiotic biosynthesis monooxygenase [Cyanobacteria bacterium P01_F01_bin.33]